MLYFDYIIIFIYKRKKYKRKKPPQKMVKINANAIFFCKSESSEEEKGTTTFLNSVLTCNCHSSSLQLSPTIFLVAPVDRLPLNPTTSNRLATASNCNHCSKKMTRHAFGSIFWSLHRVGESLYFRDDRAIFLHHCFFSFSSTFFLSRVYRV